MKSEVRGWSGEVHLHSESCKYCENIQNQVEMGIRELSYVETRGQLELSGVVKPSEMEMWCGKARVCRT